MPNGRMRIPSTFQVGIKALLSLPEDRMRALISGLETLEICPSSEVATGRLSSLLQYPEDRVSSIVELLMSLYGSFASELAKTGAEALAKRLVDSCREQRLAPEDQDWSSFERGLAAILEKTDSAIAMLAYASRMATTNERNILESEVITEARPVFGTHRESGPKGNIIVHRLVVKYMTAGDRREFHVAMDRGDLIAMVQQLEDSKNKEDLLKSYFAERNQVVFGY